VLAHRDLGLAAPGLGPELDRLTEDVLLDLGQELFGNAELDIGLEQGHAHFAQGLVDVAFFYLGLAREALARGPEPFGEGL